MPDGEGNGSNSYFQPSLWNTAAFVGNGLVGAMVRTVNGSRGTLRIDVGRTDLFDEHSTNRLPVGYFLLNSHSPGVKGGMRQHLFEAELNGSISTEDNSEIRYDTRTVTCKLLNSLVPRPSVRADRRGLTPMEAVLDQIAIMPNVMMRQSFRVDHEGRHKPAWFLCNSISAPPPPGAISLDI